MSTINIQDYLQQQEDIKNQARFLDDVMRTRIRAENRTHAALRRDAERSGIDCPERGTTEFKLACAREGDLLWTVDDTGTPKKSGLNAIEHEQYKRLVKVMESYLGPNLQAFLNTPGIGVRLLSRLLGEIGHPVLAFPAHWEEREDATGTEEDPKRVLVHDEPFERTPGQLWQYCGHGKAERRKKGMPPDEAMRLGNPDAKKFVYLLAESAMKSTGGITKTGVERKRSPYRNTYDEAKARYEATRPDPPEGQQPTATEWTRLHRHNAALRITGKEILRDLWRAAKADLELDLANATPLAA